MIIVDSNYLIALMNEKDQYHQRAKFLLKDILKSKHKIMPILMLSEAITSINARKGSKLALKLYNIILDEFKIFYPNSKDIEKSMNILLKYDGTLSLADSLAVHYMQKNEITYIYSFDSDFDKVNGIIRKY